VHGGPEHIHLEAWRTGAPLLQITQASREVCIDSRGRPSPCSAQGLLIQATSPHGTSQKGELLLYLAATTHMVSTAIVVERQEDGHAYPVQRPVYFIREVLSESKARYQPVQKLLYAVLLTSRKLRHYFQEYSSSPTTRSATPVASSQTWAPTSTTTSSGSTARTAGSTSVMSQSPIHGPTDKLSHPEISNFRI
jgi:hypothetical protein